MYAIFTPAVYMRNLEATKLDLVKAQRLCRYCFDPETSTAPLISPCRCSGSSQYIHTRCLERWQETALENNLPLKAMMCSVCMTYYRYPNWFYWVYRRVIHYFRLSFALTSMLWITFAVIPMKTILHAILVIVTLPFGQLSLGDMAVAWVGCDFPPQLALIRTSTVHLSYLKKGVILVATRSIPDSSIFHRAVVLVLQHEGGVGSRGVILNLQQTENHSIDSNNLHSNSSQAQVGYGGPLDSDNLTILHDSHEASLYSEAVVSPSSTTEAVYVAEEENAYKTIRLLLKHQNKDQNRQEEQQGTKTRRGGLERALAAIPFRELGRRIADTLYTSTRGIHWLSLFYAFFNMLFVIVGRIRIGRRNNPQPPDNHDLSPLLPPAAFSAIASEDDRSPLSPRPPSANETQSNNNRSSLFASINNFSSNSGRFGTRLRNPSYRAITPHRAALGRGRGGLLPISPCNNVNVRFLRGNCLWTEGQLDGEVRAGDWHVLPVSKHEWFFPANIGSGGEMVDKSKLWNELLLLCERQ